jgi:hypothetical protein
MRSWITCCFIALSLISSSASAYEKYASQKEAGDLLFNEVTQFNESNDHYPSSMEEISLSEELKRTLKKEDIEYFTFQINEQTEFSVTFKAKFSLFHCYKGSNNEGNWRCFLRK